MEKYHLGLALSGGGAKGFAHCGALQAMEEFGLKPEIIAGTSAGAIVGALYAAGNKPASIAKMFMGKELFNFVTIMLPKTGFLDHTPFLDFLAENLHVSTFEELKIPLYVLASDLDNGVSKIFKSGDLPRSILASCCIPIVFNPVEIDGIHYVDGGLFRNFPVLPIRNLCDQIIGINVSPLTTKEYKQNLIQIAQRSYQFMFKANVIEDKKLCDILCEVQEAHQFSTFDLENIDKLYKMGYDTMVNTLEQTYGMKRQLPYEPFELMNELPQKKKKRRFGMI